MRQYKRFFIEKDEVEKDIMEIYKKEYEDLLQKLKNNTFRNKEKRIEFAQIIIQLSTNPYHEAKKLIYKMGEFAKYWQNDEMIDEDEWKWLNNSENLDIE